MQFTTMSGSAYEINLGEKRIRRLSGVKEPTGHQGQDLEWKSYLETTLIAPGLPVEIIWRIEPEDEVIWVRRTVTSPVKEVLG